MAKKIYKSPILMELTPEDDPVISVGGSQESHGENTVFTFETEAIENACKDLGYFELSQIDTDGDFFISEDEYNNY